VGRQEKKETKTLGKKPSHSMPRREMRRGSHETRGESTAFTVAQPFIEVQTSHTLRRGRKIPTIILQVICDVKLK